MHIFVTRKPTQGLLHGLKSMLSVPPRIKAIINSVTCGINVSLILPGRCLKKEDLQLVLRSQPFVQ